MGFQHTVRVRYGEVDMQRVVFNAHYLAYCDDAADLWFRTIGAPLEAGDVGRHGEEGHGDLVGGRPGPRRAGDRRRRPSVGEHAASTSGSTVGWASDPVFSADITYVAVRTGTTETVPVPDEFRAAAS